MFSVSWVQRNVKTRSWVRSVKMGSPSSGDGAGRSDSKRTQIPNISHVMQLLADSPDTSGGGLNLSDFDVGGRSSVSDVEGVHSTTTEAEPALPSTSSRASKLKDHNIGRSPYL